MEKKYLIPMVDFVEESRKKNNASPFKDEQKEIDTEELYEIYKQSHLRKQEAILGLFVPTDKKGKYLEEPKEPEHPYNDKTCDVWVQYEIYLKQYQEAKERVIFVGFTIEETNQKDIKHITNGVVSVFWYSKEKGWYLSKEIKTLEDLTPYKLEIK